MDVLSACNVSLDEITNSPAARRPGSGKKSLKSARNLFQDGTTFTETSLVAEEEEEDVENSPVVRRTPSKSSGNNYHKLARNGESFIASGQKSMIEQDVPSSTVAETGEGPYVSSANLVAPPSASRRPSLVVPIAWQVDALQREITQSVEAPSSASRAVTFVLDELNTSVEYVSTAPLPKKSASVSSIKRSASKRKNDEIDKLNDTLIKGHWTRMRDALTRITEMIRCDEINGEGLLRLSNAIGIHVQNGKPQFALAACECVQAACEVSSLSSKVKPEEFDFFSRQMAGPVANAASSLCTPYKPVQDAGMRCLLNLYLANPKLDLRLVLGPDSAGYSRNVAARRAAADLVFNLILHGLTVERDVALAEAVARFFSDNDPDTRRIARVALKELVSRRSPEWIENHILRTVKGKGEDAQMPHFLKQFALEYPETGRLLGLETPARPLNLMARPATSAVKNAPHSYATMSDGEGMMLIEDAPEDPQSTPPTPVSLKKTTGQLRYSQVIGSGFKTPAELSPVLGDFSSLTLIDEAVKKTLVFNEEEIEPTVAAVGDISLAEDELQREDSPIGELLVRKRIANQKQQREQVNDNKEAMASIVPQTASSPLDDAILERKRLVNLQRREQEKAIVVEPVPAPLGDRSSSPAGQQLWEMRRKPSVVEPVPAPLGDRSSSPAGQQLWEMRRKPRSIPSADVESPIKDESSGKKGDLMTLVKKILTLLGFAFVGGVIGLYIIERLVPQSIDVSLLDNNEQVDDDPSAPMYLEDLMDILTTTTNLFDESTTPMEKEIDWEFSESIAGEVTDPEMLNNNNNNIHAETKMDTEEILALHEPVGLETIADEVQSQIAQVEDVQVAAQVQVEHLSEVEVEPLSEVQMEQVPHIEEQQSTKSSQQTSNNDSSFLSIPLVLCILVALVFRPSSSSSTEQEAYDVVADATDDAEESAAVPKSKKTKRVSPPKGRFSAIEVQLEQNTGQPKLHPVMRSRRVVEPETVSMQEAVTVITPRKPLGTRRSTRTSRARSKSK